MKRISKIVLSLLLAVALAALASGGVFAREAGVRDSGECGKNGDNLTWSLSDDYVLTISGSGEMKNYSWISIGSQRAPWYEYRHEIDAVVIDDGVTSIGEYAFYDCDSFTIRIPQSLTRVRDNAFDMDGHVNAVYYMAPIGMFGSILVDNNNGRFTSAPRHSHVPGGGTSSIVTEGRVEPTCTAAGRYYTVESCNYCGLLLARTYNNLSKLGHQGGAAVTENEIPATPRASGSYDSVIYCVRCQAELSRVTVTVPYVCSHIPGAAVFENEGYNDELGGLAYDEAVYCTVCGAELSRVTYKTPYNGHRHTPGETAIFNEAKDPETGVISYEEVVYCGDCHLEMTRSVVTGSCPHTWRYRGKLPVFTAYTIAQPSDIEYGSLIYDMLYSTGRVGDDGTGYHHYRVEYCRLCETVLSMEEHPMYLRMDYSRDYDSNYEGWQRHYIALGCVDCNYERTVEIHAFSGDQSITRTFDPDDQQAPTCTEAGYRGFSVNCASCAELYRLLASQDWYQQDPSILGTPNHYIGTAIYGTVDYYGREIIPAIGHANAVTVPASEATATEHGYTEGVYCPDCGTWLSGHREIHNTLGERTYLDEYTEDGEQIVNITCTVCGGSGQYAMEPVTTGDPEVSDDVINSEPMSPFAKAIQSIINVFLRLIQWITNMTK